MLSEGVDRRGAIPIVPNASHDTGYTVYLPPMIRDVITCNSEMLQWSLGLVAGVAMCNFLRTCEFRFLYLKLASCENKLLILTSGNSKYSELKRKIKVAGTNMGQEDSTALTGIAH